ncbi:MAG: CHAD domain-containing protein [Ketobacteraceae bacterium]|nr:CHAD domain-containing protein [Ketobacteraceae bacterium]
MNHIDRDPVRTRAKEDIKQLLDLWDARPMAEESIHQLRVCTKRLRAYLRVYPPATDISGANQELKCLADSYASVRDAQVAFKTLNALIADWPDKKRKKYREVIDFIAHQKRSVEGGLTPREPHEAFECILLHWPSSESQEEPGGYTRDGLDRLYQKARQLGNKALQSDADEPYHRWRKWVKYWLYCLTGLSRSKLPKGYKKRLKRLGDSLGVFHDICVLEQNLKNPDVYHEFGKQLKPFYKAMANEKKRMQKSYKKAHKKLFGLSCKERDRLLNGLASAES